MPVRSEAAPDEALSPDAIEHLRRGAEFYRRKADAQTEVEFARAEHFAPDWPGVHFNQAAAAEAQGKLDVAIDRYRAYLRPSTRATRYAPGSHPQRMETP